VKGQQLEGKREPWWNSREGWIDSVKFEGAVELTLEISLGIAVRVKFNTVPYCGACLLVF